MKYYWEECKLVTLSPYAYSTDTVVPPYPEGDIFQDLQWMPEIADSSELYISSFFSIHKYL